MNSGHKIIITGGGLIGCSLAWRLAQRGAQVTVVESARPGSGASAAAAGMLAPLIEAEHAALRDVALRSLSMFPEFVRELHEASGIDAELQLTGKYDIAFNEAEFEDLRGRYGKELPDGVRAASTDELSPSISKNATHAIISDYDGSVDNRKLARAAWLAASNAGVEFHVGASVREVLCGRGPFEGVVLSTGERIAGDAVVIASGAWSSSIRGLPLSLPVFPVRGQIVALEHVPRVLDRLAMTVDCYIVPRTDGRVLIGSTVERVGFDPRTTAHGIATLLNAGLRAVPALHDASVVETWAGLRPGTPDDLPILGGDPRAQGVFYATGHYRNGILLAPITAAAMSDCILTGKTAVDIAAFSVKRFHE